MPSGGGVYCLSVSYPGDSVQDVLSEYRSSDLYRALAQLDAASEAFFNLVADERGEEARLKEEYRRAHGGELPPLMER